MEDVFIVIFVVVVREFVGDWLVYCCSYLDDVSDVWDIVVGKGWRRRKFLVGEIV